MYFEFEDCAVPNNSLDNSQESATIGRCAVQSGVVSSSSPRPTSQRGSLSPHPPISPISSLARSSTSFLQPTEGSPRPLHRRYSIHADSMPSHQAQTFRQLGCGNVGGYLEDVDLPGGTMPADANVSLCDLALITKNKLNEGASYIKALDDTTATADIAAAPAFSKHSNSDLRREVLLASIHRSLSASSDDLKNLCGRPRERESISFDSYLGGTNSSDDSMETSQVRVASNLSPQLPPPLPPHRLSSSSLSNASISTPMNDEQMSTGVEQRGAAGRLFDPSRRIRSPHSLAASYLPTETLGCMSSCPTNTSTTSMAGNKNHLLHYQPSVVHNRGYLKRLNALNLMGVNGTSSYYSSNSIGPMSSTLTMSSQPSLRKRIHSSSPSKGAYPYHTIANSLPSGGLLFTAGGIGGGGVSGIGVGHSTTDWDNAFKRLKVVHPTSSTSTAISCSSSSSISSSVISSNGLGVGGGPEGGCIISRRSYPSTEQLNELAQDLNRLKTPFT